MDNTPVIGGAVLQVSPLGRTVFVEGVISSSNRTVYRDWVAYIGEEGEIDDEGDRIWSVTEKATPPLLLSTNSGPVQIESPDGGNGYSLQNLGRWSWEGKYRRYRGLKVNNQVVALGEIQSGSQGRYLDAKVVARGTRNEYVAEQRNTARFMSLISIPLFVIGLLGLAGTLIWSVYRFLYSNN